jgi:hypothetical protein
VLYGKTYTFKILYKSISNLFLLQKPSNQLVFVVHLDPAIRQSSTLYSFLLMQFDESQEMELAPNLDPKIIREQYAGEFSEKMEGAAYDIVTRMQREALKVWQARMRSIARLKPMTDSCFPWISASSSFTNLPSFYVS